MFFLLAARLLEVGALRVVPRWTNDYLVTFHCSYGGCPANHVTSRIYSFILTLRSERNKDIFISSYTTPAYNVHTNVLEQCPMLGNKATAPSLVLVRIPV